MNNTKEGNLQHAIKYSKLNTWQFNRGQQLLKLLNIKRGDTILDLGSGTGELTVKLSESVGLKGKVIAIEPDITRLELSKRNTLKGFDNIDFLSQKAEELDIISEESVDIVYSNYVIMWIEDHSGAFNCAKRYLKKNGLFAMELLLERIPFLSMVNGLTGDAGRQLEATFHGKSKDEWVKFFNEHGFQIEHLECPKLEFNFKNIEHFFDWLEGTSHGAFEVKLLDDKSLLELKKRYPKQVYFEGTGFQAIVKNIK
ncbi:MAG: methyltransferase domain-containing protein [bacterium]|nr:methyltransferase domain-containing protein [bacterium]